MTHQTASYEFPAGCAAVIMAGGSGTRLWPLSRRDHPKQLMHIFGGRSLLRDAFDRLATALPVDSIHVIGLAEHRSVILGELPELPAENFIGEPTGRDTAAAIALSASILYRRNPDGIMGVFTADHFIRPADRFMQLVGQACQFVSRNRRSLVTFGVKPSSAHTGMGYLEIGEQTEPAIWRVNAYKEKPDAATAQVYLQSGRHFWNAGIFVWTLEAILDELSSKAPATYEAARKIAQSWGTPESDGLAEKTYPGLQRISIDYAVMEKAGEIRMVEMENVEWIDVGHWSAMPSIVGTDPSGNCVSGARFEALNAGHNIVVSEKEHLIAAVGVENLVIVHSEDATLICRRDQVDKIKELVEGLKKSGDKTV